MGELQTAGYASDVLSAVCEGRDQFHVYGCGLTESVLLKEAVEQARRLGRNVIEQALREEKRFVGEHDGTCLLCHLDVIVLAGGGSRLRSVWCEG